MCNIPVLSPLSVILPTKTNVHTNLNPLNSDNIFLVYF